MDCPTFKTNDYRLTQAIEKAILLQGLIAPLAVREIGRICKRTRGNTCLYTNIYLKMRMLIFLGLFYTNDKEKIC